MSVYMSDIILKNSSLDMQCRTQRVEAIILHPIMCTCISNKLLNSLYITTQLSSSHMRNFSYLKRQGHAFFMCEFPSGLVRDNVTVEREKNISRYSRALLEVNSIVSLEIFRIKPNGLCILANKIWSKSAWLFPQNELCVSQALNCVIVLYAPDNIHSFI